jgi:hypothetical protein
MGREGGEGSLCICEERADREKVEGARESGRGKGGDVGLVKVCPKVPSLSTSTTTTPSIFIHLGMVAR